MPILPPAGRAGSQPMSKPNGVTGQIRPSSCLAEAGRTPGSARGKAEPAYFRHRYPSQMAPFTTAPPSARSPCPPPSPSSASQPSRAAPSSPRSICPPLSKRSATSPSHAAGGNQVALTSATAGALGKPISALTRALGCPKLRPDSRPISRSGHAGRPSMCRPCFLTGVLHLAH